MIPRSVLLVDLSVACFCFETFSRQYILRYPPRVENGWNGSNSPPLGRHIVPFSFVCTLLRVEEGLMGFAPRLDIVEL